jgi:hypothetical protein
MRKKLMMMLMMYGICMQYEVLQTMLPSMVVRFRRVVVEGNK